MTTVVDPNGTPVPIYNRSGKVVLPPMYCGPENEPTAMPSVAEVTIVTVIPKVPSDGDRHIRLPALSDGVDIGDVIEVYGVDIAPFIFPPDGEAYLGDGTGAITLNTARNSIRFRRVDSSHWAVLQSY